MWQYIVILSLYFLGHYMIYYYSRNPLGLIALSVYGFCFGRTNCQKRVNGVVLFRKTSIGI